MKCPYCGQFIGKIREGKRCPACNKRFGESKKNREKPANNKEDNEEKNEFYEFYKKAEKNSVATTNLLETSFDVFCDILDNIVLLIILNIFLFFSAVIINSNTPEGMNLLIGFFQFTLFSLVHILIIKKILYNLEGREINFKKIFSWNRIKRGIKVYGRLLVINIPVYVFLLAFFQELSKNSNESSILGLISFLLCTIGISLFVILLDFVLIEYEGNISESFKYTLLILKGNELKLLVTTFTIYMIAISFVLHLEQTYLVVISTFAISAMGLTLYLGYYQALKNNRIKNKFETLN